MTKGLGIAATGAIGVGNWFFGAFVLTRMWGWFVVPLGVPAIGMAQAMGLALTLALMVTHLVKHQGADLAAASRASALPDARLRRGVGPWGHPRRVHAMTPTDRKSVDQRRLTFTLLLSQVQVGLSRLALRRMYGHPDITLATIAAKANMSESRVSDILLDFAVPSLSEVAYLASALDAEVEINLQPLETA